MNHGQRPRESSFLDVIRIVLVFTATPAAALILALLPYR